MDLENVQKIISRIQRFNKKVSSKHGDGTNWSVKDDKGINQEFILKGIKPHEEFEDEITSSFIWLWSIKDYIKKYSIEKQFAAQWVETKVNNNPKLCIIADIANSNKHGGLTNSRSNYQNPKLGKLIFSVPHYAIDEMKFSQNKMETKISKPEKVTLKMDIVDSEENKIYDVFEILDYGLNAWKEIITELEEASVKNAK